MPASPMSPVDGLFSSTILLDGKPINEDYEILSIDISTAINTISFANLTIGLPLSDGPGQQLITGITDDFKTGRDIVIKLGYEMNNEAVFQGMISNYELRGATEQGLIMTVHCTDKAILLDGDLHNRYFEEKTDAEVIRQLFNEYGLQNEVDDTAVTHQQLIQYQMTDWDYTIARAQSNNLLVYTEQGRLLVKAPSVSGPAALVARRGDNIVSFNIRTSAPFQLPEVAPESNRQEHPLRSRSLPGRSDRTHQLLSGKVTAGSDLSPGKGTRPVKSKPAAASSPGIYGTVTLIGSAAPRLNTMIELTGFHPDFNRHAIITGIRHAVDDGEWSMELQISSALPQAAKPLHQKLASSGLIEGLHTGTVVKIDQDPNHEYRIQVKIPELGADTGGLWARLANFYATGSKGAFFVPEIGDEVVVGFLNSDPTSPTVLGSLYSRTNPPPYTAYDRNDVKAIVTKSDLRIAFDERDKVITVKTPGGNRCILSDKDKMLTLQDQNGNKIELSTSGISLQSAKDINIKATGNINVTAGMNVAVNSSANLSLAGVNVTAKAKLSFHAQGEATAELIAAGTTTVKGAVVKIN